MASDYDLFVIGGGINGCGIARDAAGRGYRVGLAEMHDFAWATSSASTKLFHGGLRYLEYFELPLVREALQEREILLRNMPHISWPMRFVMPLHRDMRFENTTPASRLLSFFMPWMKGRRPNWLIRFGLFLYDSLGGRKMLPGTARVDLTRDPVGQALLPKYTRAFEYSDGWVDDARLVILNARDAALRGADMLPRTKVVAAHQLDGLWHVQLRDEHSGDTRVITAKMLINAAGPWTEQVIQATTHENAQFGVRLVRGSHIVVPRKFDHDKAYFLQGTDGRIIFAIPYEADFTLIGTTDADHDAPDTRPEISGAETDYLIDFANQYFKTPITRDDIVWTYSGVRPLFDDGAETASAATRDYVLKLSAVAKLPLLNIFGGKITTYRHLAMSAMDMVDQALGRKTHSWTHDAPLPGGDFAIGQGAALQAALQANHPYIPPQTTARLIRQYGTDAAVMLGQVKSLDDMGRDFGAGLYAVEVAWLRTHEWAMTAQDILWRRSKLGLRMQPAQVDALQSFLDAQ